jgi:cyclopropane-fatty-acyl-phospholipid synthase
LLRRRLEGLSRASSPDVALAAVMARMDASPIALSTRAANQQHYEVPAAFFEQVLGPRLKYSCALWDRPSTTLAEAEDAMLALSCQRAGLVDGQRILELGCGWGSLSLWMAAHYPESDILAVSNSHSQRAFITARAAAQGLRNLHVVTADMNDFAPPHHVDRIVSVEMFEHMRNHRMLLCRMAQWMAPKGEAFIHVFCHRDTPYFFDVEDDSDWMAKYFFTGGMMPSLPLLGQFDDAFRVATSWTVNGTHYARTLLAWLARLDAARPEIVEVFARAYGRDPEVWVQRWRLFLLACAELFAYREGEEWFVAHYRLTQAHGAKGPV